MILAFTFDIILLFTSFVDSLSGIAVAAEFYENGDQKIFCYTFALLLIFGVLVEAMTFLIPLSKNLRNEKFNAISARWNVTHRIANVSLAVLLSPILPFVHYFIVKTEYFDSSKNRVDNDGGNSTSNNTNTNNYNQPATWYYYGQGHVNGQLPQLDNNNEDDDDILQKSKVFHAGNEFESYVTGANTKKIHESESNIAASSQRYILENLDDAVLSRRTSLFMSNVQALSGSLPRSVVLIIAISVTDQVTPLQVFALSVSLFSLTWNAHQLCRSFSLKHFIANVAFIAFDLFSAALILLSIFSSHHHRSSSIPRWMFQIWIFLHIQSAVLLFLLFVVRDIKMVNEALTLPNLSTFSSSSTFFDKVKNCASRFLALAKQGVASGAMQAAVFVCILVFVELIKFGVLPLYYLTHRASPSQFYLHRLLHEFIWRKDADEESKDHKQKNSGEHFRVGFPPNYNWQKSLDLLRPALDRELQNCINSLKGPEVGAATSTTPSASQLLASCLKSDDDDDSEPIDQADKPVDSFLQRIRHILLCDIFFRVTSICPTTTRRSTATGMATYVNARTQLENAAKLATWDKGEVAATPKFSWLQLLHFCFVLHREKGDIKSAFLSQSKVDQAAWIVFAYIWLSTTLFGILYPFLALAVYLFASREPGHEFLNPMATICLAVCLPLGILCAALLVDAIKTQITCAVGQQLQFSLYSSDRLQNDGYYEFLVDGLIPSYYSISPIANVLHQVAIRENSKVPFDCLEKHVACFLSGEHVKLYGMTTTERRQLEEVVME